MASREETEVQERFGARFRTAGLDASIAVEREAVGSDYGNNGYTTMDQVDAVVPFLALGQGDRLLDVGSGTGFPGLYLAQQSGCDVIVSDLTVEGMRNATGRAADDGLAGRSAAVVASARQLPFRPDSFDAIVHTDVLCWLTAKLSVLRACRRLLRPGGRLAFFTIHVAHGLSRAEHRRAVEAAPASAAGPDIAGLLRRARFDDVEETDLTAAYEQTARDWLAARLRHRDDLRPADPEMYDYRVDRGRNVIPIIEAGLLRRSLFLAVKS